MKWITYAALGYVAAIAAMLLLVMVLFTGGPQALCESATDETILVELVQLQRMGCPADVVMMVLSYLRDKESEGDYTAIAMGLNFLQLRVAVEVLECDCEAADWTPPPDTTGDTAERPDCTCDYEFDRVEEYNTAREILSYLVVLGTPAEPLAAANLQQRGEAAAAAHCANSPEDDRATAVFQPTTYTASGYSKAIELCGVTYSKDIKAILDLHRQGAFIEFLTQESKRLGFSEDDYIGRYPAPALGGITCPFGYRIHPTTNKPNFHRGIDIGTQWHTPIMAIAPGTVVGRGTDTYNGRYILIRHDEGGAEFYSYYGHLSQWQVKAGDRVAAGDIIGLEGGDASDPEPGYSTGHHLHFEIRMTKDGGQVNPLGFLKWPKEE